MQRRLSFIDKMIANADQALRTLVPSAANATQSSPAENQHSGELDEQQRLHIAGLMGVSRLLISIPVNTVGWCRMAKVRGRR